MDGVLVGLGCMGLGLKWFGLVMDFGLGHERGAVVWGLRL